MPRCPEGFFESREQAECLRCHPDCALCTGPSSGECAACADPDASLYHGECAGSCPSHHYRDALTGECAGRSHGCDRWLFMPTLTNPPPPFPTACDESCRSCAGPHADSCTSCRQDHRLDGLGRCARPAGACPPHQYAERDGECPPCHTDCRGCWGPSSSHCLSCSQRRLLLSESRLTPELPTEDPRRARESLPRLHPKHLRPLLQMAPAWQSARRDFTRMSQSRNAAPATLPVSRASEGAAATASSVKAVCSERATSAWRPASTGRLTSFLSKSPITRGVARIVDVNLLYHY